MSTFTPRQRAARKAARAAGAPDGRKQRGGLIPYYNRPRADQRGRAIIDSIGREDLIAALSAVVNEDKPNTPAGRMLAYLQSEKTVTHSFTTMARNAGLTLAEIVDLVRNYEITMGMLRAARHVPDVLEDIAEDSRTRLVICPSCGGAKEAYDVGDDETREIIESDPELAAIIGKATCTTCNGVGYLRQLGSTEARKLLLETVGLLKRGGPAIVSVQKNTQINNYGPGGSERPEDIATRVQRIIDITPSAPPPAAPAPQQAAASTDAPAEPAE